MYRKYPDTSFVAYEEKGHSPAFTTPANQQKMLFNLRAHNNSGGLCDVGICRQLASGKYKIWKKVSGVYTDITDLIVAGTPTEIFSGAANDGFVIQSERRLGLIGIYVSTAQAGGTFTYTYWAGITAGLTTLEAPTNYSVAGENYIVFPSPYQAVPGGPTGLDQNMYTVEVLSTVAPAGAVSSDEIWLGEFLELFLNVPSAAAVQISFPEAQPFFLNASESVFPYFSVPSISNTFGAYYVSV